MLWALSRSAGPDPVSRNLAPHGQGGDHTPKAIEQQHDQRRQGTESQAEKSLMGVEGEGFKIAMQVCDRSRPMVASVAVGVARRCLEESTKYACQRKTMGVPIAGHQAVGFKLAEMGMKTEAARQLVRLAAWKLQSGQSNTLEAAYAKAFAADTAMESAVEAVQVFGGYGYSKEYPVEKLMRDAKVLQIYEGTSEIQRAIMVRELTRRLGKG